MKKFILMILGTALLGIFSCDQDDTIESDASLLKSKSGFKVLFDTRTDFFDDVGSGSIGPVGDYLAAVDFTLLPDNKTMHLTSNASKNGAFGESNSRIERWAFDVNTEAIVEPNPNDLSGFNALYLFPKHMEAYGSRFGMKRGTSGFYFSSYGNSVCSVSGDFNYSRNDFEISQAEPTWTGEFVENGYANWTSNTFTNHKNNLGFYYQRQDGTGYKFRYQRIEYSQHTVIRATQVIPSSINGDMVYFIGISDAKIYLAEVNLADALPANNPLTFTDSLEFDDPTTNGGFLKARMSDDQKNLLILAVKAGEDARLPLVYTALYNLAERKLSFNVKKIGIPDFQMWIPKYDMDNEGNLYYPTYDQDFSYELDRTNNFSIYKLSGNTYTTVGLDGLMSDPPTGYPNTRYITMVRVLNNEVYAAVEYIAEKEKFGIERRLAIISNN